MPKMMPIPIVTQGQPALKRIWRWLSCVRQWELLEDWEFALPNNGPVIIVPKGFVFDGASVPRLLWWLLSPTGLLLIPAIVHDFSYRYDYLWALDSDGSVYKYKEHSGQLSWDNLFRKISIHVNNMVIVDTFSWLILVFFGWMDWMSNCRRNADAIFPDRPVRVEDNLAAQPSGV